ncbi:MAG TPA: serine/threonine-protein kinase [Pseudonocardiaceae bacterium]|nr:serine/threonine-protein kinase [Pseudonocardiaceae bacterium]
MTEQHHLVAGRYRLGERVGVGAMGVVWRARDERLRRTVAVKQLLVQPGLDAEQADEARQRAMREARIAARLQHVNVVVVYDVAEDDDQPWLIMEYVPSRSLATALRDGPLTPFAVAGIGAQAAAGLAAAHEVGVVHRDVKPGNVLLGDDGLVKIADFGISRAMDDVTLTATGLLTGTPAYLSPEMAKGETPAPPSDVFSLGATLYAAVEGTPPFGVHENPLALLHKVAGGRVRPPERAGPLTEPLMDLLRADPADRPTMHEARAELSALVSRRAGVGPLPIAELRRAWTTPVIEPVDEPAEPTVATPLPAIPVVLPPPPPRTHSRRRTARLTMAIALMVLALGVALVVVDTAGSDSPAAVVGPVVKPTAAPTPIPTTTVPVQPVATPPSFQAMAGAVRTYYGLLPTDVTDAYQLLSAGYRTAHPFAAVRTFYDGIESVTPGEFRLVGPNQVAAVITFVTRQGAVTHEPYQFTVVRRRGALIIDDAVQLDRDTGM